MQHIWNHVKYDTQFLHEYTDGGTVLSTSQDTAWDNIFVCPRKILDTKLSEIILRPLMLKVNKMLLGHTSNKELP